MANDFKIIDPYDNYDIVPQTEADGIKGNDFLNAVKSLQVGFGSQVLRIDRGGLWLGASDFASAPFSVDMEGNMTATSLDLSGYLQVGEALTDVQGDIFDLSDIDTDLGVITAGTLIGVEVRGSLIRTSTSGDRIEIDDSTNNIEVYDSGGTKRVELDQDEIIFYNSGGAERGGIYAGTTEIIVTALNGGNLQLQAEGSLYGVIVFAGGGQVAAFTTAGLGMNEDITMNGNHIDMGSGDIIGIDEIVFDKRTSTPNRDGEVLHYDNGSAQSMRVQMDGVDFTFDLSFL
jgi:hypothetical protein